MIPPLAAALPRHGRVAQLVEQGIENPRVGGSIPSPATTKFTITPLAREKWAFFCQYPNYFPRFTSLPTHHRV